MSLTPDRVATWTKILGSGELAALGREADFCERNRKLTSRRLFLALTLGTSGEHQRSIAGLARFASLIGSNNVTRQALHQRLDDPAAADFLRRSFVRLSHRSATCIDEPLPGKLATYEDCLLLDSSVVGIADLLGSKYPACRTNVRAAGLKIHARMSLTEREAAEVRITGERFADCKAVTISRWVKDRLVMFDLGYLDYEMLQQIVTHGGAFCCRLKTTSNGVITAVRNGCAAKQVGRKLNDLTYSGSVVDLDVRLGNQSEDAPVRVAGVWNDDARNYHWYATSLDPKLFSPEEVAKAYALRWQIELLFKEWKSLLRLGQLPSAKETIVMCLIYAALCASVLARLVQWMAAKRHALPWFELSTRATVAILGHWACAFASAILRGRDDHLRPTLDRVLEAVAAHSHLYNNANAIRDFGKASA